MVSAVFIYWLRSSWAHYCMQHSLIPRSHKVGSGYITRKIFQYCKPGDVRTLKFLGLSVLTITTNARCLKSSWLSVLSLNVVWPILCLSYSSICLLFLTIIEGSTGQELLSPYSHPWPSRWGTTWGGDHTTAWVQEVSTTLLYFVSDWFWRPLFEIEGSSANSVSLFELFITQLKAVVGFLESRVSQQSSDAMYNRTL